MIYIVHNNSITAQGGVEGVVRKILENAPKKLREQITVVCSPPAGAPEPHIDGVTFVCLPAAKKTKLDVLLLLGQLRFSKRAFEYCETVVKPGDIINIHGTEYGPFFALGKKSIPGVKLVLSAHGSYFQQYTDFLVKRLPWSQIHIKGFFWIWRWYAYFIESMTVSKFDQMVYICRQNQQFYERVLRAPSKDSLIIYNGAPAVTQEKFIRPKHSGVWKFIIVGASYYLKGLDTAVDVVANLNALGHKSELVVVGFSQWEPPKGRDDIKIMGKIAPDKMHEMYQNSDILMFPSRFEGFPLTTFEALVTGMPVVVSNVCKYDEVDQEERAGIICEPTDVQEFTDAAIKIIQNYDAYSKAAYEIDLSRFSWNTSIEDYTKYVWKK